MEINIDTKLVTLLGTPLGQSYAARMQNEGYRAAGLNLLYFYTETDQSHLGNIVNGIRHMNFAGFAVTKPNKVEILKYLDELEPFCAKMGSCNTVVKTENGRLVGYNTDGSGFYKSLTEEGQIDVAKSAFFCIGSGGVGRAICFILAHYHAKKLYITDIFEESARALVQEVNQYFEPVAEFVPYGQYEQTAQCDVILNASGVGMGATI